MQLELLYAVKNVLQLCAEVEEDSGPVSEEELFLRSGHYFPTLPVCRSLQRYSICSYNDCSACSSFYKCRSQSRLCCRYAADRFSQRVGATCSKEKYRHRRLTPGLFFVYCLDCNNCVGFVAMPDAESPRTLFEVIYVHWPTQPEVVVYDNSCHAMTYALNREPEWFKSVVWIIDATHFPGHTGCAHSFNIKRHPTLAKLNSQICEQRVSMHAAMSQYLTCLHHKANWCVTRMHVLCDER